jgi:hypothetical protein
MNNDNQIKLTNNLPMRKKKPLWVLEMIWMKTINIIPNQNPSGKQKAPSHASPYYLGTQTTSCQQNWPGPQWSKLVDHFIVLLL